MDIGTDTSDQSRNTAALSVQLARLPYHRRRFQMLDFIAIALLCAASVPSDQCTPDTALDVWQYDTDQLGCLNVMAQAQLHFSTPAYREGNPAEVETYVIGACHRRKK